MGWTIMKSTWQQIYTTFVLYIVLVSSVTSILSGIIVHRYGVAYFALLSLLLSIGYVAALIKGGFYMDNITKDTLSQMYTFNVSVILTILTLMFSVGFAIAGLFQSAFYLLIVTTILAICVVALITSGFLEDM